MARLLFSGNGAARPPAGCGSPLHGDAAVCRPGSPRGARTPILGSRANSRGPRRPAGSRLSVGLIGSGTVRRVDSPRSGPAPRAMGDCGVGHQPDPHAPSAPRWGTEAGGLEPPRVVNPPHFECGALPVRLRLRRLYRRSARESSRACGPERRVVPPDWIRGTADRAGPIVVLLATDLSASAGTRNRGARIRTGDLCDPNAALYRTEPRPERAGRRTERTGEAAGPSAGSGARDRTM